MKKIYGTIKIGILCYYGCIGLFMPGCTTQRVLEVHKIDTFLIDQGRVKDTILIFKAGTDTIQTDRFTIYRNADTFRYYFRERNCTTFLSKTIIQPERIRQVQEKNKWPIRLGLWEKIILLILSLTLLLYVFRRRS